VDLVDRLDGVQMIDAWIKSNLVHHHNTCLLRGGIELPYGG
jgi:hypothetical protein